MVYSTAAAARAFGCDPVTVRRRCIRAKAGTPIGVEVARSRVFTADDVERLRSLVRPGRGRPRLPR